MFLTSSIHLIVVKMVSHGVGSQDVVSAQVGLKAAGLHSRSIVTSVAGETEGIRLIERDPTLDAVTERVK